MLISASPGPAPALIFRRPAIRRRLEAVTGTVLIALAARVAVSTR
ncbi:MAG: hypothetical protein M0026_06590 [Nocardiopsaceae bacterium]|nr:hypothetical protein [Nocardiopsaceae bacterium]